jgi:hypothetical protein
VGTPLGEETGVASTFAASDCADLRAPAHCRIDVARLASACQIQPLACELPRSLNSEISMSKSTRRQLNFRASIEQIPGRNARLNNRGDGPITSVAAQTRSNETRSEFSNDGPGKPTQSKKRFEPSLSASAVNSFMRGWK